MEAMTAGEQSGLALERELMSAGLAGVGLQIGHAWGTLRLYEHFKQPTSLLCVPGQVSYTRSDFLVNKDTMELDLPVSPDYKADPQGMPHYNITNSSHLGIFCN